MNGLERSDSREMHNHSRAFASFTFYFNRPSFVSHDAINRGQSQAISLSRFLGGKKGLEHPGAGVGVHAATDVADGDSTQESQIGYAGCVPVWSHHNFWC